jgi:L-ribulose-5-phosphate 4-epimerase
MWQFDPAGRENSVLLIFKLSNFQIFKLVYELSTHSTACHDANMQLPKLNLVLFTFGNVSVVDRELNVFAIKPSGVPYEELRPEKMVIVDLDGKTVEGSLRPSSDTLTHAVLYKHWPKIGSIVHTHSTYATAWAQTQRDIPMLWNHTCRPYNCRYSLCSADER